MTFYGPQSCSLPACKGSKLPKFQTPSPTCTLGPRPLPQQAPEGQATAMAFYFQSCRLPARKPSKTLQTLQTLHTLQNPPNPPNTVPSHAFKAALTGGQGHSNDFLWASKLQFAKRIQTSKIPNTFPNMHPRAKATSPTGTPGPGHSNGFLWAFQTLQTLQTLQNPPNPPNTVPSRHLRSTAMTFLMAAVCQPAKAATGARATAKIPNTFPNMHPRAKATSPTGTPGPGHSNGFLRLSKLPFASPQTLQNSPNAPNAPNPPKPAKPSKHRPQQAPQIHSNDFLDAFKAALTGGQGHSNDFLWASKLQFASLQRIQTSKIPNTFPNMHPRAKATSPTGTPGPGHSNGFLWAFKAGFLRLSKLPFASPQTLQNSPNPPNAPNPPKPAKPSKHRPQQAPQIHSNDFLDAFKAAVCQPAKAATPLKFQTPSLTGGQGHSQNSKHLPQHAP